MCALSSREKMRRKQVLPGVLLHVIETALPVDLPVDFGSGDERLCGVMPDLAVFVFGDLVDGDLKHCAVARGRGEISLVERLATAGRIKRRTVERYLPQRLSVDTRDEADVGDDRARIPGEEGVADSRDGRWWFAAMTVSL